MSIMDQVKKNLREWYALAADRTGDMAKISVRMYDKYGISREIERQLSELGSYVYHAVEDGRTDFAGDAEFQAAHDRIKGLERDLDAKMQEIEEIRQQRQQRQAAREQAQAEAAAAATAAGETAATEANDSQQAEPPHGGTPAGEDAEVVGPVGEAPPEPPAAEPEDTTSHGETRPDESADSRRDDDEAPDRRE